MGAGTYNFTVEQGASFERPFTVRLDGVNPTDLTGYSARMQLRANINSPTPTLELTTGNGRIQLGSNGVMTIIMSDVDTAALPAQNQIYDLELVKPDTTVVRLLKGQVTVDPEVTR